MAAPAGVNEGTPRDHAEAGLAHVELAGAQSAEVGPAEAKPAGVGPAEAKPAETKPAGAVPWPAEPPHEELAPPAQPAEPPNEELATAPQGEPATAPQRELGPAPQGEHAETAAAEGTSGGADLAEANRPAAEPAAGELAETEPAGAELAGTGDAARGAAGTENTAGAAAGTDAAWAAAATGEAAAGAAGTDAAGAPREAELAEAGEPELGAKEESRDVSRLAVAGIILGIIALVGVAVGVLAVVTHGFRPKTVITYRPAAVFGLRPGECINSAANGLTVTVLSCRTPHDAEVFATFALPAGAWPGAAAVQQDAGHGCVSRLDSYLNPQLATVALTQEYIYPNRAAWQAGERTVVCEVRAVDGQLTGSVRATS